MPGCAVKPGEVVVVGQDSRAADCTVEQGAKLRFLLEPEEAKEPSRGVTEPPTVSPPPAPVLLPPRPSMDPVPAPVPVATPAPVPEPAPLVETKAHTEQPVAPTASDLGALAQQGGGGMTGVILAIIAVAGGGAAWKFYSQRSEQQHELEKEKLKFEAQQAGLNGAQPPPCQAANTAIQQQLAALTARVEAAEKKSSSFSADFDGEAVERQLKRLQKQVKELQEDKT